MLRSIKQLYGDRLGASDGEIGHVKDFYFDDQTWAVRYLVADTGTWLTNRQVLLSPHVLGNAYLAGKVLAVNLTRKQIEDCPPIELHKPVSRQYEEDYYRYYGWPNYWQGDGLWGMNEFPILESPKSNLPSNQTIPIGSHLKNADVHLRSTQAVKGYHLHANDGIVGHVVDFMMDETSWAIGQLVIKTGNRFTGKEVQIPTNKVTRISYDESSIFVDLTKSDMERITLQSIPSAPNKPITIYEN
jgi:sporulation protein YlmC with PRC-barrel domain